MIIGINNIYYFLNNVFLKSLNILTLDLEKINKYKDKGQNGQNDKKDKTFFQ